MNMKHTLSSTKQIQILLLLAAVFLCASCMHASHAFAVCNALDGSEYRKAEKYRIVVVDPDLFDEEQLAALKASGTTVYAYVSAGSIEAFREGYEQWMDDAIAPYEGYHDEYWADVSSEQWQEHVLSVCEICRESGYDGLFLDNIDVCDVKEGLAESMASLLGRIRALGMPVMLNGGMTFCLQHQDDIAEYTDCIVQEEVFTLYDRRCQRNNSETTKEYLSYLKDMRNTGTDVKLIEYSDNPLLILKIRLYGLFHGMDVQIARNPYLNG